MRQHNLLWSQQSAVFSSSLVCHSSRLSHFTPGPHLQSCSPGLHLQSTPLHKPLDSLLSVPDRTTHYSGNDTCLAPVILVTSLSLSRLLLFLTTTQLCFPLPAVIRILRSSSPASLLPRQPHPIPASPPRSINPFSSIQLRLRLLLGSASFNHNTPVPKTATAHTLQLAERTSELPERTSELPERAPPCSPSN